MLLESFKYMKVYLKLKYLCFGQASVLRQNIVWIPDIYALPRQLPPPGNINVLSSNGNP